MGVALPEIERRPIPGSTSATCHQCRELWPQPRPLEVAWIEGENPALRELTPVLMIIVLTVHNLQRSPKQEMEEACMAPPILYLMPRPKLIGGRRLRRLVLQMTVTSTKPLLGLGLILKLSGENECFWQEKKSLHFLEKKYVILLLNVLLVICHLTFTIL